MVVLDIIKNLSKEKGWSLSFLASKLGLTASYFTDVKNGKTKISDDRLAAIADLLNTTPEYLKGETDTKEKPAGESTDGLSDYDARLLDWFHSLPLEKRQAILEIGDGPKK